MISRSRDLKMSLMLWSILLVRIKFAALMLRQQFWMILVDPIAWASGWITKLVSTLVHYYLINFSFNPLFLKLLINISNAVSFGDFSLLEHIFPKHEYIWVIYSLWNVNFPIEIKKSSQYLQLQRLQRTHC